MQIINDNTCDWINDLQPRLNIRKLEKDSNCEWLVIGAGYSGLSAARKLGELFPNQEILLIDAQLAGEGSSGRNSGYLVDTTLNDGFTSNKELERYKKKSDIYSTGIQVLDLKNINRTIKKTNDFNILWKKLIEVKQLYVSNILPEKWFTVDDVKSYKILKRLKKKPL